MPAHYDKNLNTEFGNVGSDLDAVWHRDAPHLTEAPGSTSTPGVAHEISEEPNAATLVSDGTEPADGDTVTVNNVTYRFKTTMAAANDVKLSGTTSDADLDNLVAAVNQTGAAGTNYFAGTAAPANVRAAARQGSGAGARVVLSATGTGAAQYPVSESSAHLSLLVGNFQGQAPAGESRGAQTGLRRVYISNTLTEFGTGEEAVNLTFAGGGTP